MKILVINGPNLNMLGIREPKTYGKQSFFDLQKELLFYADRAGILITLFQCNECGEIVEKIQAARGAYDGIVLNPGALTHYAHALSDAIEFSGVPTVEVHLSNIFRREAFRHESVTAPSCIGGIFGLGFSGYRYAIDYLLNWRRQNEA